MSSTINAYITFRYPNWMDYARHQCKVQHLEGWADDLMNDIIADLLRKPVEKMEGMIARRTTKIVNGQPTTELDKFVLRMIATNARSHFASFRKNTVGQKIIATNGNSAEVATFCELTHEADQTDESSYNSDRANRLDTMHQRNMILLHDWGYSREVCQIYSRHFIQSEPMKSARQKMIINEIMNFLTQQKNESIKSDQNYDQQFADSSERFERAGTV